MGCITTGALVAAGAILAPVTMGASIPISVAMAAGAGAGYLAGEAIDEMGNIPEVGSPPVATPEEQAYGAATTESVQTQSTLMKKQIEQMDAQLAEQKEMNATIDEIIAKNKATEEALANDPEYRRIKAMEEEVVKRRLEDALGLTVLTPEMKAEIDTQWNASKEAAQAQIDRSYGDVVGKISSGREEDLATIDADYTKLLAMVDRETLDKTRETYRSVSPLMRNSATLEGTMAKLAIEISRVKEDLISSQATAKEGVVRRARAGTAEATTEKARATEQLAKETEAGKLGAYEAKKYGLGVGYSSLPPYYTTGVEAGKKATELQTSLLPYQTKLGISRDIATNFATPVNTAVALGQTSGNAANAAFTRRFQPWQVETTLNAQAEINAENRRMALLGAVIGAGGTLGGGYIQGKALGSTLRAS